MLNYHHHVSASQYLWTTCSVLGVLRILKPTDAKLGTSWPQLHNLLSTLCIESLQVVNVSVETDERIFPVSTTVQLLGLGDMKQLVINQTRLKIMFF